MVEKSKEPRLLHHLESRLGPLKHGCSEDIQGDRLPFSVAVFQDESRPEFSSIATFGLSNVEVAVKNGERNIRLELVLCYYTAFGERNLPSVVQEVATLMLRRNSAILRGELLELRGVEISGTNLGALYVTAPVYFDDGFGSFVGSDGVEVAIAWLVPVHRAESLFISQFGWDAFEDRLVQIDPDLRDLNRAAI